MSEHLEISKSFNNDILDIYLKGRIDAYWSTQLDTFLEDNIREGHYTISLNLREVTYVSSAGIRVLLKYFKLLKDINGSITLCEISENVSTILEMVGLLGLFSGEGIQLSQDSIPSGREEIVDDVRYFLNPSNDTFGLNCRFTGNPDLFSGRRFTSDDMNVERFDTVSYGLGLGAFGNDFEDCKDRFGEFIGLGEVICYLPSDSTSQPDYMIRSGQLVPTINSLYSIIFSGSFNHTIRFDVQGARKSVPFSQIFTTCMNLTKFTNAGIVMLAETTGLVGASLTCSPAGSLSGISLFHFPEVRDRLHITTEPEYDKMLTATAGIIITTPDEKRKSFLRPVSKGSDKWGHFHTAVFSYHPLKKDNIELNSAISSFFENDKIQDILHMINDERELTGIGESEFKSGTIWIGKINGSDLAGNP